MALNTFQCDGDKLFAEAYGIKTHNAVRE